MTKTMMKPSGDGANQDRAEREEHEVLGDRVAQRKADDLKARILGTRNF